MSTKRKGTYSPSAVYIVTNFFLSSLRRHGMRVYTSSTHRDEATGRNDFPSLGSSSASKQVIFFLPSYPPSSSLSCQSTTSNFNPPEWGIDNLRVGKGSPAVVPTQDSQGPIPTYPRIHSACSGWARRSTEGGGGQAQSEDFFSK